MSMLIGKNIKLRALRMEDLDYINAWRNDLKNKIMSQGFRLPITKVQDENWLKQKMSNTSSNEVYFIIESINDANPIGLIQLTEIDYISGLATWGLIIGDKNQRGKGYSKEAAILLFKYAFNMLNLNKIIGYPILYNDATIKMHKSIGIFKEEGILNKHYYLNGEYHDILILSVFREDFMNKYFEKYDTI